MSASVVRQLETEIDASKTLAGNQAFGFRVAPPLVVDDAQQVERIEVIGRNVEDRLVEARRLVQRPACARADTRGLKNVPYSL